MIVSRELIDALMMSDGKMTRVIAPETEMGLPIGDNRKQAAGGKGPNKRRHHTRPNKEDETDFFEGPCQSQQSQQSKKQRRPREIVRMIRRGVCDMGDHVHSDSMTSEKAH